MPLSVRLTGVEDAVARMSPDAVQGTMQEAVQVIGDDLATPKGAGMGVQVNSLSLSVGSGLAVVESTSIWPRTTGETWLARSQQEGEAIAEAALEAAGAQLAEAMG